MVLSHTPLKMFDWLFNKRVLISGQQDIKEIVQGYPLQPFTQHYTPNCLLQEFGEPSSETQGLLVVNCHPRKSLHPD